MNFCWAASFFMLVLLLATTALDGQEKEDAKDNQSFIEQIGNKILGSDNSDEDQVNSSDHFVILGRAIDLTAPENMKFDLDGMELRADEEFYQVVEGLVANNRRKAELEKRLKFEITKKQVESITESQRSFAEFSNKLSEKMLPRLRAANEMNPRAKRLTLKKINSEMETKLRRGFAALVKSIEDILLTPQVNSIRAFAMERAFVLPLMEMEFLELSC